MAVVIRLKRTGKKKVPFYSVVAADSRSPRDGKNLERLGWYDPNLEEDKIKVDDVKLKRWLDKGASLSDTVRSLLKSKQQDTSA